MEQEIKPEQSGQPDGPKSRKKDEKAGGGHGVRMAITVAAIALAVVGLAVGVVYVQMGSKYQSVFFPGTSINGLDASQKTVEEVERMISADVETYRLTLTLREGKTEVIEGSSVGLHAAFDGSLARILETQEPNRWITHLFKGSSYQIETMIELEQTELARTLNSLECMDGTKATKPQDARLSEYVPGKGYSIVPEAPGNSLNYEATKQAVEQAILSLETGISLEEAGCYEKPAVTASDEQLKSRMEQLNRYAAMTVTYQFGGETITLGGDVIQSWMTADESGNPVFDQEAVATYVRDLAARYNTYNKAKTLRTSTGQTVKITGGTYGWKINQVEETAQLLEVLKSGESQTREPVYSQKAASHGETDYGDTYVEINLTAQHIYFYKDGKLVVESDFVSGNLSKGWDTPAGAYALAYKQRDAILKGEGYRTPVSYWMPFNGGIGLHDANWRSTFGGTIYKTGGSHGCVNLPPAVAKTIYENISAGTPVLCYHLEGSEKGTSTPPPAVPETTAAAKIPETAPPETTAPPAVPETTAPPATESQPPVTKPAVVETTAPAPPNVNQDGGSSQETGEYGPGGDGGGTSNVGPGA